jgi:hypothetical protein
MAGRRLIWNGRTWRCVRPGHWIAPLGLHLYRMMAGTQYEQWEVWLGGTEGEMVADGLTMRCALRDLAQLEALGPEEEENQ